MSDSRELLSARDIVLSVRASFREAAEDIDANMLSCGYDEDATHAWLERFSQLTTDAIKRKDFDTARGHLSLMSRLLSSCGEEATKCIDVAYVESLLWDIRDETLKREGWKIIPANLRALYLAMWRERDFMKGKK